MNQYNTIGILGEIQPNSYLNEVTTDGLVSRFRGGLIYRYPGLIPMLEVQGDHYAMGLQYGVLLHEELKKSLVSFNRILGWSAARFNTPAEEMLQQFKAQALNIFGKLPERYVKELEGVSEATGLPLETVAFLSLNYDVLMSGGCTGVLMRTETGGIIHARNNDTAGFGGEELGKMSLVVKHRAGGFHTVTHIDYPFFMGVETGYNSQGLTFSEETLGVKEPNPNGFSLPYLIRMTLEECGSLEELPDYFDRYPVIGAYGTVWSDRRAGKGMVAELTPWGWAHIDQEKTILWNLNHIYSEKLLPQQASRTNINPDLDREAIARAYAQKAAYTVADALDFIGLQKDAKDIDYTNYGSRNPVCNKGATQAMVFDPDTLDFYLGVGVYYAARQNIYRIHDEFSQKPTLFRAAAPMKSVVVEVARIFNLLESSAHIRDAYIDLSTKYQDEALVYFLVAQQSFMTKTLPQYSEYADKACALQPEVGEYRLYAGLAAYQIGDWQRAVSLLEQPVEEIDRKIEPIRLYALQKSWEMLDRQKSATFARTLEQFLSKFGAEEYFLNALKPLIDRVN